MTEQDFQEMQRSLKNIEQLVLDLAGSVSTVDTKIDALRIDFEEFRQEAKEERRREILRQATVELDLRDLRTEIRDLQERIQKLEKTGA